ncbi:SCP-2 family sterol carrier protein [Halopseudomonas laoshanensis]|jgi:putative sterol carrier protein|uniref:SCP-2 family sterol carrier protein n=2 Tax=Halopseudomonas TaxID=2901189 RepID=A0A7V7GS68_9GAMM|nr:MULTISPECIES: SCP2 sterol-binding domain-containing protein [Halopseudomonas]MBQ0744271.1 SCP2 sterol-binding domain-containing protein [Pseudomonas sp.]WOD12828.1 SCP2 sterol-binding domain-containing protein [Pseudomonas sp. NyZ704]KAA0693553.1 SCP-2 family sterol carrier protein [Halopseudomonas laoshanensis]MBQ0776906.1 SCP2 sterol-binding domain-containing protein [Pseudomonas sp.]PCC98508.1 SCP-2 family sterol carrier protein [Halopseudomonas pelagia]
MTSVAEITSTMESKFNPAAAAGLDLVFQFNIEDDNNFNVTIKDGTCAIAQGDAATPNVTLIMDKATLEGVMTGETDGMQAFMAGKLRAEGDMMLALKLGELFPA